MTISMVDLFAFFFFDYTKNSANLSGRSPENVFRLLFRQTGKCPTAGKN